MSPDDVPPPLPEDSTEPEELGDELPDELGDELPDELGDELPDELAEELGEELPDELADEPGANLPWQVLQSIVLQPPSHSQDVTACVVALLTKQDAPKLPVQRHEPQVYIARPFASVPCERTP